MSLFDKWLASRDVNIPMSGPYNIYKGGVYQGTVSGLPDYTNQNPYNIPQFNQDTNDSEN